jgi:hypothetical protein
MTRSMHQVSDGQVEFKDGAQVELRGLTCCMLKQMSERDELSQGSTRERQANHAFYLCGGSRTRHTG